MLEVSHRGAPRRIFSPAGLLIIGFIFLSGVGGLLLALPIANNQGVYTSLDLAYFTAISAVTVTGHTVLSTSTYWSTFGQVVIFLLMLIGGLGFMVLATFLLLLLGGRSTLQERLLMRGLMQDTVGVGHLRELRRVGRTVVLVVFLIYGLGTIGIFFQVRGLDGIGLGEGLWHSLFLSVSSFNNAGFNILPELPAGSSLARFAADPIFPAPPHRADDDRRPGLADFGGYLPTAALLPLQTEHKTSDSPPVCFSGSSGLDFCFWVNLRIRILSAVWSGTKNLRTAYLVR